MKQIARENNKIDDKRLRKKLAKKMNNPFYLIHRALLVGFNITLENHHINHNICKVTIKPNYIDLSIEAGYIDQIPAKVATIYAIFLN